MHISAGGGSHGATRAVERIRSVVVYDAPSGRVLHTHHAVTFAGGRSSSDEELKARALMLARETVVRRGGTPPRQLAALSVDPASLKPGVEYRVDTKRHALVAAALKKPVGPPKAPPASRPKRKGKRGAAAKARRKA